MKKQRKYSKLNNKKMDFLALEKLLEKTESREKVLKELMNNLRKNYFNKKEDKSIEEPRENKSPNDDLNDILFA